MLHQHVDGQSAVQAREAFLPDVTIVHPRGLSILFRLMHEARVRWSKPSGEQADKPNGKQTGKHGDKQTRERRERSLVDRILHDVLLLLANDANKVLVVDQAQWPAFFFRLLRPRPPPGLPADRISELAMDVFAKLLLFVLSKSGGHRKFEQCLCVLSLGGSWEKSPLFAPRTQEAEEEVAAAAVMGQECSTGEVQGWAGEDEEEHEDLKEQKQNENQMEEEEKEIDEAKEKQQEEETKEEKHEVQTPGLKQKAGGEESPSGASGQGLGHKHDAAMTSSETPALPGLLGMDIALEALRKLLLLLVREAEISAAGALTALVDNVAKALDTLQDFLLLQVAHPRPHPALPACPSPFSHAHKHAGFRTRVACTCVCVRGRFRSRALACAETPRSLMRLADEPSCTACGLWCTRCLS